MTEATQAVQTTEKVTLSKEDKLVAKIEAAQAKIVDLQAAVEADTLTLQALQALAAVSEGDVVVFVYGRGETRGEHTGTVLGVQETDQGRKLKVYYGSGFDADTATITAKDIVSVVPQSLPVEEVAEEAAAE